MNATWVFRGFANVVRWRATVQTTFEHQRFVALFVHEGVCMAFRCSYKHLPEFLWEWKLTDCHPGILIDIARYSTIQWISNDIYGYPRILTWSAAFREHIRGRPRRRLRVGPVGPRLMFAMGHMMWAITWAVHESKE